MNSRNLGWPVYALEVTNLSNPLEFTQLEASYRMEGRHD